MYGLSPVPIPSPSTSVISCATVIWLMTSATSCAAGKEDPTHGQSPWDCPREGQPSGALCAPDAIAPVGAATPRTTIPSTATTSLATSARAERLPP